jgi:large subunit ribosomal protein L18
MTHNKAARVRFKLKSTNYRKLPRLSVHRSGQHTEVQIIDDQQERTLAAVSTKQKVFRATKARGNNKAAATWVGQQIAQQAQKAGISEMILDRGRIKYHPTGCLDALATAVRAQGIKI